jgi:hypothetical protein
MRTRKCARRSCRAGTGKRKPRARLMRYHTAAGLLGAWLQLLPGLASVRCLDGSKEPERGFAQPSRGAAVVSIYPINENP